MNLTVLKKLLVHHWDELVILIITLLLLVTIFLPFFLTNSLDKFDTPGLLSLSWFIREYKFPDFSGWNPFFFAGFPQGILYPPLFHWLVAGLGKIFELSVAYKLVVKTSAVFIPYSIYEFSLKIYKQKPWAILCTLLILLALIILPGYLGFNFDGLFDYGLGPSFVTIPLFFGYLAVLFDKNFNWKLAGILFGLMLLTNLVAPLVAGLITISYVVVQLISKNKSVKSVLSVSSLLKFVLLTILLTTFWIIPYISFLKYTASGIPPMSTNKILSLTAFFGALFCFVFFLWKRLRERILLSILSVMLVISLLALLDSFFNFKLPVVHLFRLQIFPFIAIAAASVYIIRSLHPLFLKLATKVKVIKYLKRNLHIVMVLVSVVFVLSVISVLRLNPNGVEEVKVADNLEWQGRIMRVYKVTEVLDQSRSVIDKSAMNTPDRFAVDGLLKESSYLAPFYQSLAKSLNPENYNWEELDQNYIENYKLPSDKTRYLMNLMWVKSLFTIDKNFPDCSNFNEIAKFKSNSRDEGLVERTMYICDYTPSQNSNLVEMLMQKPKVINGDWNKELEKWWKEESIELFTNEEVTSNFESPVYFIPQVEFSENYQEMHITTGINEEFPYLVKMSYFPKWKAYDSEGNEVKIYRISPNFMMVPIKEEVTLRYEMTTVEWISLYVSVLSWVSLGVVSIFLKVRKIYRK